MLLNYILWLGIAIANVVSKQVGEQVAVRPCYIEKGLLSLSSSTVAELATAMAIAPSNAHVCPVNQTCFSDDGLPVEYAPIVAKFNRTISFDHAGAAYYAVFVIGTMEGWTEMMHAVSDAVGGVANAFFFVTFVLFGGYILLSMIVGALTGFYIQQSEFAKNELARTKKHVSRMHVLKTTIIYYYVPRRYSYIYV